jgi:uncharacterized membrane protein YeaQ/YmgE (transglycosylase-associated protein family)
MSFSMFVTWVLVGVLIGVLAGLVMKRGGYGLKKDVTLALVGAIGGSWIFRVIGLFPEEASSRWPSWRLSAQPCPSWLSESAHGHRVAR